MRGQRYRMKTPPLAIVAHDGQNASVTIPKGGEAEVVDGAVGDNGLVDVSWEGKSVMMFTNDIRDRGEPLD